MAISVTHLNGRLQIELDEISESVDLCQVSYHWYLDIESMLLQSSTSEPWSSIYRATLPSV